MMSKGHDRIDVLLCKIRGQGRSFRVLEGFENRVRFLMCSDDVICGLDPDARNVRYVITSGQDAHLEEHFLGPVLKIQELTGA